jgi:hypothetical protein
MATYTIDVIFGTDPERPEKGTYLFCPALDWLMWREAMTHSPEYHAERCAQGIINFVLANGGALAVHEYLTVCCGWGTDADGNYTVPRFRNSDDMLRTEWADCYNYYKFVERQFMIPDDTGKRDKKVSVEQ